LRAVVAAALALLVAAPVATAGYREQQVRETAQAAGFADVADRLAEASRPTLVLNRKMLRRAPRELGTTRLGGLPDLPRGQRWPQCGGRAQTFLGQFRLRDLPRAAEPLRRHGGRLYVFTEVEFEDPRATGYGLSAGRCTTALHAPIGRRLTRTARPRGEPTMRLKPARIRFARRPDVPDLSVAAGTLAPPLLDVAMDRSRWESWWAFRDRLRAVRGFRPHRMLGYIDTPNGERGRCWSQTRQSADPWEHLFTIGLDYDVGWEVGDFGRLQVAISPADLRRGRFDRVCGIFDGAA
jgi:Domain of unknown function (DUF1963)